MSQKNVRLLRAGLEHLEKVATLFDGYRQFYGQTSDLKKATEFIKERLEKEDSVIFLALDEKNEGLGFTQLFPSFSSVSMKRLWILNDLFVSEKARNKSVAKSLIIEATKFAEASGAKGLTLKTAISNTPAIALYESLKWTRDVQFHSFNLNFPDLSKLP